MNIYPHIKAIVRKGNEFLIVKRSANDDHSPGRWSSVGGGVEVGETFIQALHREVMEEAKIVVKPVRYLSTKTVPAQEGGVVLIVYVLCDYVSGDVTLNEEHDEFKWVSEIPDYIPQEYQKVLKEAME